MSDLNAIAAKYGGTPDPQLAALAAKYGGTVTDTTAPARQISPAGADRQTPGAWSGGIANTLEEGAKGLVSGALSVVNPMTYVRGMQAKADANRQDYEDFKAGLPRGSREHRVGFGEAISNITPHDVGEGLGQVATAALLPYAARKAPVALQAVGDTMQKMPDVSTTTGALIGSPLGPAGAAKGAAIAKSAGPVMRAVGRAVGATGRALSRAPEPPVPVRTGELVTDIEGEAVPIQPRGYLRSAPVAAPPSTEDASFVRGVPAEYGAAVPAPPPPQRLALPPHREAIQLPHEMEDSSFVRSVPAEYGTPAVADEAVAGPTKLKLTAEQVAKALRDEYGSEKAGQMLYGKQHPGTIRPAERTAAIKRLAPGKSELPNQAKRSIAETYGEFQRRLAAAPNQLAREYILKLMKGEP